MGWWRPSVLGASEAGMLSLPSRVRRNSPWASVRGPWCAERQGSNQERPSKTRESSEPLPRLQVGRGAPPPQRAGAPPFCVPDDSGQPSAVRLKEPGTHPRPLASDSSPSTHAANAGRGRGAPSLATLQSQKGEARKGRRSPRLQWTA